MFAFFGVGLVGMVEVGMVSRFKHVRQPIKNHCSFLSFFT